MQKARVLRNLVVGGTVSILIVASAGHAQTLGDALKGTAQQQVDEAMAPAADAANEALAVDEVPANVDDPTAAAEEKAAGVADEAGEVGAAAGAAAAPAADAAAGAEAGDEAPTE